MAAEPKKAAACILFRDYPAPEVLLARRNPSLRFMGGHHVFPGGRVNADETAAYVVNATDEEEARTIHAVAREVFEETGIFCARGTLPNPGEVQEARRALLEDRTTFDEILERCALTIHAEDFEPAGAWVTPQFSPIRFDTRYFIHHVIGGQRGDLINGEIVGLDWFSPAEARRQWREGAIKISTPVAYALQQLAARPYPDVLPLLNRVTERAPGEHNRFEIRRGITVVPLKSRTIPPATHTNCILVGEDELIVIDPGAEDPVELDHLQAQLNHFIELGASVRAIVLTHSHPDHIAGVELIRSRYDLPVWAHGATDEQVGFTVDRHLEHNEVIELGGSPPWRLRALHTPGHDPGHLCFLEETTRVLLAGDMVANPGTIVVSREYGGDMAQFMSSLESLMTIESKVLIPSHGLVLAKPREFLQKHLEHRQWRENKIKSVLDTGVTTLEVLLAKAYDDVPKEAHPWARHALDAHLAKLGVNVQ